MSAPASPSASASLPNPALRALVLIGRLCLGAIFLYAAYTKLRHPWILFAMSVNSYQVLPEWGVTLVARTLPWLELAVGALLLTGYQLRWVAAAAAALLAFFFSLMLRSYFQGQGIDCGCFGFGEKLGVRTLVRDGGLVVLALALTGLAFRTRHKSTA